MNEPEIVYSDKNFAVINKPAGLLVHPTGSSKEKTLVDFLLEKFPEIINMGDIPKVQPASANQNKIPSILQIERPGIIHRLDKDTSGIIIVARNQRTFEDLKQIFKQRKIEKKYLALVCGFVSSKSGIISLPIGRLIKNPTKRGTGKDIKGEREAQTRFNVLNRYKTSKSTSAAHQTLTYYSLLEIVPKTGRTHQIRVHMKSIGHPVACDKIYGGKNVCCPLELKRMFLHAKSIEFSFPEGKRWKFEADLPYDLRKTLEGLEKMTDK